MAYRLTHSFMDAGFWIDDWPGAKAMTAYYADVQKKAVALLEAIGFPARPSTVETASALVSHSPAIERLSPRWIEGAVISNVADRARQVTGTTLVVGPQVDDTKEQLANKLNSAHHISIWEALQRVPPAVALLADLATLYGQAIPEKEPVGRRVDEFSKWLFVYLAVRFKETFGCAPNISLDRAAKTTDSLLWIRAVMQIVANRLPLLKTLDGSDAKDSTHITALASTIALAPATLADRLRNGWNEYSRLLDENAPGAADGFQPPFR